MAALVLHNVMKGCDKTNNVQANVQAITFGAPLFANEDFRGELRNCGTESALICIVNELDAVPMAGMHGVIPKFAKYFTSNEASPLPRSLWSILQFADQKNGLNALAILSRAMSEAHDALRAFDAKGVKSKPV